MHLLDGTNSANGRVEACVDGRWLSICDEGWTDEDAEVVCAQLGVPVVGECSKRFVMDNNVAFLMELEKAMVGLYCFAM